MKLHKHFLPEDIRHASEEYWCVMDLLTEIMTKLQNGEMESAKHRSIDLTKSLHELSMLSGKKYTIDRRNEIVNQMNAAGVHVELVRRQLLDRKDL